MFVQILSHNHLFIYLLNMVKSFKVFAQMKSISYIQISPRPKALFSRFAAEHPLREIKLFAEKNTYHFFSPRDFSARCRGENPRKFAEKFREISRRNCAKSRWVDKDLMYLHADSEDSDQTVKLSKCQG